jgi:hypothetical protein
VVVGLMPLASLLGLPLALLLGLPLASLLGLPLASLLLMLLLSPPPLPTCSTFLLPQLSVLLPWPSLWPCPLLLVVLLPQPPMSSALLLLLLPKSLHPVLLHHLMTPVWLRIDIATEFPEWPHTGGPAVRCGLKHNGRRAMCGLFRSMPCRLYAARHDDCISKPCCWDMSCHTELHAAGTTIAFA